MTDGKALSSLQPVAAKTNLPVFILGLHRSGTSLLRTLIDAHPEIACVSESKFLVALQQLLEYPQVYRALQGMEFSKGEINDRLRMFALSLFQDHATKRGKRRWADKTPNYYKIMPFLNTLFDGKLLFVVIVRHPLDTIISLENYFFASEHHDDPDIAGVVKRFGRGRYAYARFWQSAYEEIYFNLQTCRERVHIINYENLVSSPKLEMEQLFSFLGEELPDDLVDTAFLRRRPSTFGDKKLRSQLNISEANIGRWKAWPIEEIEAAWMIVGRVADLFGYRPLDIQPRRLSGDRNEHEASNIAKAGS